MAISIGTLSMIASVTGFRDPDNNHYASEFDMDILSAAWTSGSGGRITFTVQGDTQVPNGSTFTVNISGMTPSGYNGTFTATVNIGSRDRFYVASSDPGTATVLGKATKGFAVYTRPTQLNDTRKWDVFAADLGMTYNGWDGYIYGLYGDTFGSNWTGPDTTRGGTGDTTLRVASNGKVISTFNGEAGDTLELNSNTGWTTGGGHAVIRISSDSNKLAYFKYGSRTGTGTSTVLNNVSLVYANDSTKTLTTSDVIRSDDSWTGAGWRSNVAFRSATTDLSSGYTIDTFLNLSSENIAQQAIPGVHQSEVANNVFPPSRNIATNGITVASNVVTVTTTAAHRLVTGAPVTVAGVTNTSFNGTFIITSVPSTTTFTYALTLANTTSTGGTVIGSANITSFSTSGGITATFTTDVAHGLEAGMGVLIAGTTGGTGTDGEWVVYSVGSSTQFTIVAYGCSGSGSAGTARPALFAFADPLDPADGVEGSVIPAGAIAIEFQAAPVSITNVTWSGGTATYTTSTAHYHLAGERVLIAGLAPSALNGTQTIASAPTSTTFTVTMSDPGSITDTSGTSTGTRHYCYYWCVSYFSTRAGSWFSNYMGIAYSDNKANTWTREGISGATYNNADLTKVWSNNSRWSDKFQQAWPVDGGDGYIYCLCTGNGRFYDAYMMRVAKANILSKGSYEYWDGSTWSSSISSAAAVYTGPQAEPSFIYHAGTDQYISFTGDVYDFGIQMRTAPKPWGPWSSETQIISTIAFGNADCYGPFVHPLSCVSPNPVTDIYFHMSLFAPYNTYLMKGTLSAGKSSHWMNVIHNMVQ